MKDMETSQSETVYSINEVFYSIQGEGYWVGTGMVFIRLCGCNLTCSFCDTQHLDIRFKATANKLVEFLKDEHPNARIVCLTGGEPTFQKIDGLVERLKKEKYKIHMETNGFQIFQINYKNIDWITLSPKAEQMSEIFNIIHEVKWLIGSGSYFDLDLAVEIALNKPHVRQFVQPVDCGLSDKVSTRMNLEECLNFVKDYPMMFRLSPQMHKFLNVD